MTYSRGDKKKEHSSVFRGPQKLDLVVKDFKAAILYTHTHKQRIKGKYDNNKSTNRDSLKGKRNNNVSNGKSGVEECNNDERSLERLRGRLDIAEECMNLRTE